MPLTVEVTCRNQAGLQKGQNAQSIQLKARKLGSVAAYPFPHDNEPPTIVQMWLPGFTYSVDDGAWLGNLASPPELRWNVTDEGSGLRAFHVCVGLRAGVNRLPSHGHGLYRRPG